MPGVNGTVNYASQVLGTTFADNLTVSGNVGIKFSPVAGAIVPVTGALTRSSVSAGTITSTATPTVTAGNLIDVYWSTGGGGYRAACVVGTISGNSVPITGGIGDNLPSTAATPVCYVVNTKEAHAFTGNNALFLGLTSDPVVYTVWTFYDATPTPLASFLVPPGQNSYIWISGSGVTNPLSGDAVASISVSQDGGFINNGALLTTAAAVFPTCAIISN